MKRGDGGPGLLITAESQTAGRGRRGRSWTTLPGRSLACTLVIRAPVLERPGRASLAAGVAVARACEAAGSPPLHIKWPNDLVCADHKAGGLLLETLQAPDGTPLLLIGVGLNLGGALDLPRGDSVLPPGDLGLPSDPERRLALARAVGGSLMDAMADPTAEDLMREFRRRSWLDGRRVRLSSAEGPREVLLQTVSGEGDLLLEGGERLRGEHVTILAVHPAD